VEDDPEDAGLAQALLEADHFACEITRVETRAEFSVALQKGKFDLILADYTLPAFDGLSALHLARNARPDLPFIFVSGTLGEDVAIDALKVGATDYVLKTRLTRLVPAVRRSLREVQEKAERKKAEEALRRGEQVEKALRAQASLLDLTHDAIFLYDMNGVITFWNRGAEALYGWTADEARGKVASELFKTVFPIPLELKDGRWEGEFVRATKDGTQVVVASRWSLERDAAGRPVGILETNNNITERKQADQERERLRQLEADLAHTNRVSMLGELAASLAHEVAQPITAATADGTAFLRWLERDPPDLEKARRAASRMLEDVSRAADIIDRTRSLYRRRATQRELVDINDVIRQMVGLLHDAAERQSISLYTELELELPAAMADRVQLQQVLMNLILNGIEAMNGGSGELKVESQNTDDGLLLVLVTDSGIGLPAEQLERLFEPFYSTKPQGTGMGLSISRRIVESHGGRLSARPNADRGATFFFTLPAQAT
jgi:PAS domain S-box-containing protein